MCSQKPSCSAISSWVIPQNSMDPLKKRILGRTGIEVTQLGFGAGQLGHLRHRISEAKAQEAIGAAYDAGINFWDTSPYYGHGRSEHRLGYFLRGKPRDSFLLQTKVGRVFSRPRSDPTNVDVSPWAGGLPFIYRFDYTYDGIMRSYEDSLQRLGLNRVDLLLIHDLDAGEIGSEQAVDHHLKQLDGGGFKALDDLRAAGEIKGIGAGINVLEMIPRFLEGFDIDVFLVAMPYSLIDQTGLDRELAMCSERNIGIVKGAPYASGVLAAGSESESTFNYARTPPHVLEKVRGVQSICDRHGVHLRAAALQFLLGHASVATVIPGMMSQMEVLDNLAMLEAEIPSDFWAELKAEGLVRADAPT